MSTCSSPRRSTPRRSGIPRRYRRPAVRQFLGKPKWIVLTVLVVVATVAMVWAGFWQLRRLDERRDRNAVIRERCRSPGGTGGLGARTPTSRSTRPGRLRSGASWRRSGTYDAGAEVLIRNRSLDGAPGYHVVTPLVMADGTAVLVNRGWIPLSPEADVAPDVPEPTTGEVTVVGRVRGSQERGALGPTDAGDGTLEQLARVDVARIAQQVPYPLLPAYVELESQDPAATQPLPRLIPTTRAGRGTAPGLRRAVVHLRHAGRRRVGPAGPPGAPVGAGLRPGLAPGRAGSRRRAWTSRPRAWRRRRRASCRRPHAGRACR